MYTVKPYQQSKYKNQPSDFKVPFPFCFARLQSKIVIIAAKQERAKLHGNKNKPSSLSPRHNMTFALLTDV
jgi:hypothetical protein